MISKNPLFYALFSVRLREINIVVVETVNNEFHSYCIEAFLLTSPPPLDAYEQHDGAQTVGQYRDILRLLL